MCVSHCSKRRTKALTRCEFDVHDAVIRQLTLALAAAGQTAGRVCQFKPAAHALAVRSLEVCNHFPRVMRNELRRTECRWPRAAQVRPVIPADPPAVPYWSEAVAHGLLRYLKEAASVCFVRSFGHDSTALCPRPYSFMHGVGDLPGADTSPLPVPVV